MKQKTIKMNVLLSFVGTNDAGTKQGDGAILTALSTKNYDKAILLWNYSQEGKYFFKEIAFFLKEVMLRKRYVSEVEICEFTCKDVADHNEIYKALKSFCDALPKNANLKYTTAISSGTPAMQVCWILLAESGDFSEEYPLLLIRSIEPRFKQGKIKEVKLDTSLPKIIKLKNEITELKKDLIPPAVMNIKRGTLTVANIVIDLSPIEFCYYRYFAEKVLNETDMEKFSGFNVSLDFMQSVHRFHEESFPNLDTNREELRQMIKKKLELPIQTFRGNVSKLNKKLKSILNNNAIYENYCLTIEGNRGARFYGIKASKDKLKLLN